MINIPKEKLEYDAGFKKYDSGYRIVYFYLGYHEIIKGLCVDTLDKFIVDDSKKELKMNSNKMINYILDKYLSLNKDALAVAIYNVNGDQKVLRKK